MPLKTAAQYSGLSREKLEKAIADGELYAIKENGIGKGGKTIIGRNHLDEYLERILALDVDGYQSATKAKINAPKQAKPEANEAEEEFDAYAIAMLRANNKQFNKLCNLSKVN